MLSFQWVETDLFPVVHKNNFNMYTPEFLVPKAPENISWCVAPEGISWCVLSIYKLKETVLLSLYIYFKRQPGSTDEQIHANTPVVWLITHIRWNNTSVEGQLEWELDPVYFQLSKQAWGRMEDVLVWIK